MNISSTQPLLQVKDLSVQYGNVVAVNNINLEVFYKEIVTVIGANGAGKSSVLMALSGVVPPSTGEIFFDGEDITASPPKYIAGLGIAQVPEARRIFPQLTVKENLDLGAYLRKNAYEVKEDLNYVFELFPILKDRASQQGGTLSGGEQQMLAVARALMQNPRVLFCDEPSLGLAPLFVQKIFEVFDKLRKDKEITMLLVEQNVNLALKHSDRTYVMETGNIVISGESKKLRKDKNIQAVYLGGSADAR